MKDHMFVATVAPINQTFYPSFLEWVKEKRKTKFSKIWSLYQLAFAV